MKKSFFLLATVAVMIGFLSSCGQPVHKTETKTTVVKTTVAEPGADGFLISKQIVVKGNTVWGFSQKAYGTGTLWRDIVAQNPFLNAPGRVYFDEVRKMWIVKIYPGEVIKIGNETVSPASYVVEETTTTITTEPAVATSSAIPWWGWLLAFALVAGILLLWFLFRNYNNSTSASSASSSAVHVNLRDGAGIDLTTRATLLGREMDFRNRAIAIAEESAKRDQLLSFFVEENADEFFMSANFFGKETKVESPPKGEKRAKKEEGK